MAVVAIAASAQTSTPPATVHIVEEIVAKVNGEIITRGELEDKYKQLEAAATQSGLKGAARDEKVKAAQANVLREEIDQLLLVQKGKDMPGLTVDAEVTKYFNAIQAQYKFNDDTKFHEFLQQQTGKTYEELKEERKRDVIAQRVIGYQVASKISVPESDLQKYYDEHKSEYVREEEVFLSQILISHRRQVAGTGGHRAAAGYRIGGACPQGRKIRRSGARQLGRSQYRGKRRIPRRTEQARHIASGNRSHRFPPIRRSRAISPIQSSLRRAF
ncbi:MAG: SurA N-terminal domain-containing protein [Ignavibacteriota bacterium]